MELEIELKSKYMNRFKHKIIRHYKNIIGVFSQEVLPPFKYSYNIVRKRCGKNTKKMEFIEY